LTNMTAWMLCLLSQRAQHCTWQFCRCVITNTK
jgi:hypothetical protein